MGKKLLLLLLLIVPLFTIGQNSQAWDTIKAPSLNMTTYIVEHLYSDSLSSSFVIFIKKEVKKHKHQYHTEHVYILEGEGEMLLGEKQAKGKKGRYSIYSQKHHSFIKSNIQGSPLRCFLYNRLTLMEKTEYLLSNLSRKLFYTTIHII
jgi:mannose-6-phosphate isomerase-like protein (cupin superfamily)